MWLAVCLALMATQAIAKDQTIPYRSGDTEMTAAIGDARKTLSEFWAMKQAPEPGVNGFAIKVAISEPGNDMAEHFWLNDIERQDDGTIRGTINNDPNHVKSFKLGQRYTFTTDKISDWMFMRNGRIVGAHTLRVMIKRMPQGQAERYRKMLEKP